ncbi:ABC-type uncharacterized transport system permease subunit [Actinoplanes campanulatus]|uniref:ABC-type uncharacterized transport system permease subunit n=1 Tax=Actinoplanes campanulatus TaxID=113559 RepID=A0A7W5AQ62_9ACTN|nr:ABC-type uncharacterized transport system permease subunit [Actinoplanes campanulatus]GGN48165.1 hypothetical protein GCM10010109_85080 [Actinoplanes campanulatus]GID40475.1 hypothetical protein Aca09nite_69810 [Actinoplanes campanulatus]
MANAWRFWMALTATACVYGVISATAYALAPGSQYDGHAAGMALLAAANAGLTAFCHRVAARCAKTAEFDRQ